METLSSQRTFTRNSYLQIGALMSLIIAILHVVIIIGGADLYRFFGAGEEMAKLAEAGSNYPAFVTAGIASVFFIWAAYGASGAGLIKALPFLKVVLIIISFIYLLRGIAALPVVIFADDPYMKELNERPTFMIVSSLISLTIGLCYAMGTAQLHRQKLKDST